MMNDCGRSLCSMFNTNSTIRSPSDGLVPEQSSSRRTIDIGGSRSNKLRMRIISMPKRPSAWSALVPSMSDVTRPVAKTMRAVFAGTKRPFCASSCAKPSDCKRRVFPPEFGPVISVDDVVGSTMTVQGTGVMPLRKRSGLNKP